MAVDVIDLMFANQNIVSVEYLYIQSAAEIVKHFKILVMCFSARVSRNAGI